MSSLNIYEETDYFVSGVWTSVYPSGKRNETRYIHFILYDRVIA